MTDDTISFYVQFDLYVSSPLHVVNTVSKFLSFLRQFNPLGSEIWDSLSELIWIKKSILVLLHVDSWLLAGSCLNSGFRNLDSGIVILKYLWVQRHLLGNRINFLTLYRKLLGLFGVASNFISSPKFCVMINELVNKNKGDAGWDDQCW